MKFLRSISFTFATLFCFSYEEKVRFRSSRALSCMTMEKSEYDAAFTLTDKVLFSRFASSVAGEIQQPTATTYIELISQINDMNNRFPLPIVHDKGKSMLSKLFPRWLLTQYKLMFATPFPKFSAWMNAVSLRYYPMCVYDITLCKD